MSIRLYGRFSFAQSEISPLTLIHSGRDRVAEAYIGLGQYEEAKQYVQANLSKRGSSFNRRSHTLINLGQILLKQQQPEQALLHLNEALTIANAENAKNIVFDALKGVRNRETIALHYPPCLPGKTSGCVANDCGESVARCAFWPFLRARLCALLEMIEVIPADAVDVLGRARDRRMQPHLVKRHELNVLDIPFAAIRTFWDDDRSFSLKPSGLDLKKPTPKSPFLPSPSEFGSYFLRVRQHQSNI